MTKGTDRIAADAFRRRLYMFIRDDQAYGRFHSTSSLGKIFKMSSNNIHHHLKRMIRDGWLKHEIYLARTYVAVEGALR